MKEILILKEPIGMITKSGDLFNKIKRLKIDYKQENMILFCLNNKNRLIKAEVIFKGGLNACWVDPRTIFRKALQLNSNSIIVAHNHPSGSLEPSEEDEQMKEKTENAGDIIMIKLLDSIIFNKTEYYSMNKVR